MNRPHLAVEAGWAAVFVAYESDGGCEWFSSDLRVRIPGDGYVYPDYSVACDPVFEDGELDTLVNPLLIVDILSPSTERYDRGDKFAAYRKISTLREYVLASTNRPHIEVYRRSANGWLLQEVEGEDASVRLESLDFDAPLSTIYRRRIADGWKG